MLNSRYIVHFLWIRTLAAASIRTDYSHSLIFAFCSPCIFLPKSSKHHEFSWLFHDLDIIGRPFQAPLFYCKAFHVLFFSKAQQWPIEIWRILSLAEPNSFKYSSFQSIVDHCLSLHHPNNTVSLSSSNQVSFSTSLFFQILLYIM